MYIYITNIYLLIIIKIQGLTALGGRECNRHRSRKFMVKVNQIWLVNLFCWRNEESTAVGWFLVTHYSSSFYPIETPLRYCTHVLMPAVLFQSMCVGSLDKERVAALFQAALTDFMTRRKSSLSGAMFIDLFIRFPVSGSQRISCGSFSGTIVWKKIKNRVHFFKGLFWRTRLKETCVLGSETASSSSKLVSLHSVGECKQTGI